MVARWLVGVLVLAGCDKLFDLQRLDDEPDSGSGGNLTCPMEYDIASTLSPSRYRYVSTLTSWDLGLADCGNDDLGRTHLVVLTDDEERLDILGALGQRGTITSFWIGLSDRKTERAFLWVTDEPVGMPPFMTPPWGAGQPDNQAGNQHCVRIGGTSSSSQGYFDDVECSSSFYYLCECDGIPPNPANY